MPDKYLHGSPEYVIDMFLTQFEYSVYCYTDDADVVMAYHHDHSGQFSGWQDCHQSDLYWYRNEVRNTRVSWAELPESVREIVIGEMGVTA
jgi:hypothetical protein